MKFKIALSFIIFLIFASGVSAQKKEKYMRNPESCVQIADNFFCDQTEVRCLCWKEYLSWIRSVFGEESEDFFDSYKYENAVPATILWREIEEYKLSSFEFYFFDEQCENYPVVAISQEQAMEYSKWRSDRFFENRLIEAKKLKPTI